MKLIKKIEWQDIWKKWRESEAGFWENLYRGKEFDTWEEWRRTYTKKLNLENKKWGLHSITPKELLNFQCGAFIGWIDASKEAKSRYFKDLIKTSVFQKNNKIKNIKEKIPKEINLIGFKKGENIFIFEGNHRCIAISQLLVEKKEIESKIYISLTSIDEKNNYPFIDYYPEDMFNKK